MRYGARYTRVYNISATQVRGGRHIFLGCAGVSLTRFDDGYISLRFDHGWVVYEI